MEEIKYTHIHTYINNHRYIVQVITQYLVRLALLESDGVAALEGGTGAGGRLSKLALETACEGALGASGGHRYLPLCVVCVCVCVNM